MYIYIDIQSHMHIFMRVIHNGYTHRYQPPDVGYGSHQLEEYRNQQKLWKTWNHILDRGRTSIGNYIL